MSLFSIYEHLKAADKYDLDEHIRTIEVRKGEYVYLPSEPMNSMFEVMQGVIKLGSYSEEGTETVYEILQPGEFFGNLKYLDDKLFVEFSKALVNTRLRVYKLPFFKRIIVHDPVVAEWFNKRVVLRWWKAENKLFKASSENARSKIIALYKEMNRMAADCQGKEHHLFSLLTKKDIGDIIGATRQTVATTLKDLQNENLIR